MAASRILGKGGGHQPGERIKAFAKIGGRSVEEHSDGMREADHLEPPLSVLAAATARTSRQAKRVLEVGIRRRTPLGRSASIGNGSSRTCSATRTLTGRNVEGLGNARGCPARPMSWRRRFQA